jgi:hypothetical protein
VKSPCTAKREIEAAPAEAVGEVLQDCLNMPGREWATPEDRKCRFLATSLALATGAPCGIGLPAKGLCLHMMHASSAAFTLPMDSAAEQVRTNQLATFDASVEFQQRDCRGVCRRGNRLRLHNRSHRSSLATNGGRGLAANGERVGASQSVASSTCPNRKGLANSAKGRLLEIRHAPRGDRSRPVVGGLAGAVFLPRHPSTLSGCLVCVAGPHRPIFSRLGLRFITRSDVCT